MLALLIYAIAATVAGSGSLFGHRGHGPVQILMMLWRRSHGQVVTGWTRGLKAA